MKGKISVPHYRTMSGDGHLHSFQHYFRFLCLVSMFASGLAQEAAATGDAPLASAANQSSSSHDHQHHVISTTADGNRTSDGKPNPIAAFIPNTDALIRGSYVFGGLCFIAVLYFCIRTCRLRRRRRSSNRRTGTRKYQPLGNSGSHEMEPLGAGDDDEDEDTLFETSQPPAGSSSSNPQAPV